MRKSILLKLLMLVLCASMVLALFACDNGTLETEAPETNEQTEAPQGTEPQGTESQGTESQGTEESDTTPGGEQTPPACGGNHATKADGDKGHYTEACTECGAAAGAIAKHTYEIVDGKPTCTVCKHVASCGGVHALTDKGDRGHYTTECAICGAARGDLVDHTYETVDGKPTCTACKYVAGCKGVHEYLTDDNQHWANACPYCGFEGVTKTDHTPVYADGKYACTTCGYVYTCPTGGVHALESDGAAGHHTVACAICNAEKGTTVAHTFVDSVCACGYEAECKGTHTYVSDEEGHYTSNCTICGATASERSAHTLTEVTEENTLTFKCSVCDYTIKTVTIPEGINWYSTLGVMSSFNTNITKFNRDTQTGIIYNRFSPLGSCHCNLTGGADNTAGDWTTQAYNTGEYIIVKYRATYNASFYVGTGDFGAYTPEEDLNNAGQPKRTQVATLTATGTNADDVQWRVVLVKIPDNVNYTKNANEKIYIMAGAGSADQILDVAYVAVANTVAAACALLEEGEFAYNGSGSGVYNEDGLMVETSFTAKYIHDYVNNYNVTKSVAPDQSYAQFTGQGKNHSAVLYEKWNAALGRNDYTPFSIGASKYLVIKAMASDDNVDVRISIGVNGGSSKSAVLDTTSEFNTFIIDIEKLLGNNFVANENDGEYYVTFFGFAASCKTDFATDFTSSDYFRISGAYFCATWDQVRDYVAEDEAYFYAGASGGLINMNTKQCVADCSWVIATDGNNIVNRCGACGKVSYDYKVDTTAASRFLNFADTATWGTTYNSFTRTKMVEEGSPEFLRYTNANGLEWGTQHGFNGLGVKEGQQGQYLVLKVRLGANSNGQTYVQCYFTSKSATAGWDNGGVAFKVTEDNEWHTVVINLAERITTGAFTPNEDGTYSPDYMMIRFYGDVVNQWDADDYFDIAYVAVCDSPEDVTKLVGGDTYEWSVSTTESVVRDAVTHEPVVAE